MNFNKIKELQAQLKTEESTLIQEILDAINKIEELPGVTKISKNITIVSSSNLAGGAPWSPRYFSKDAQVSAITNKIEGASFEKIKKEINQMVENKCVNISTYEKIYLNPNAIKVLKLIKDEIDKSMEGDVKA